MAALTILPDAVAMKTRFSEFAATDDAAIQFAIEEAARSVDDTWIEGDRILAVMLLAAHHIASIAATSGADGREVTSETIGPISVTYAQITSSPSQPGSGSSGSDKESTSYGKRYLALLRKNFGGPISF